MSEAIAVLEREKNDLGQQIDSLKQELKGMSDELGSTKVQQQQNEAEINTLKQQQAQKETELHGLKEKLDASESAEKQKETEITALQAQQAQNDVEIKELKEQQQQKDTETNTLKTQAKELTESLDATTKQKDEITEFFIAGRVATSLNSLPQPPRCFSLFFVDPLVYSRAVLSCNEPAILDSTKPLSSVQTILYTDHLHELHMIVQSIRKTLSCKSLWHRLPRTSQRCSNNTPTSPQARFHHDR